MSPPPGGITAWFTIRLTALANNQEAVFDPTLRQAMDAYESRDAARTATWRRAFGPAAASTALTDADLRGHLHRRRLPYNYRFSTLPGPRDARMSV